MKLVPLNTGFYWERILVIRCQYINKQHEDFRHYKKIIFWADFLAQLSKNLTKMLPWRLKQCFGSFNILNVKRCSDTGLFRHLSNTAFCSLSFQKKKHLWESSFFSRYSKFDVDWRIAEKTSQNIFRFGDNCVWIGCIKRSFLLRNNTCCWVWIF